MSFFSGTTTSSKTITRSRLLVLETNIKTILASVVQGLSKDKSTLRRIEVGLEKQYLKGFCVYATNAKGLVEAEFRFDIDWAAHRIAVAKNSEMVLNKNWDENGVIPELEVRADVFNREVKSKNLTTALWYIVNPEFDEEASIALGLVDASVEWVSNNIIDDVFSHRDLRELTSTVRFADY